MKKNICKYIILTLLFVAPKSSYADFDITTYLSRLAENSPRDGIGKVMKDQISGLQTDSMNLFDADFSSFDPSKLKSMAVDALKDAGKKLHVSDKLVDGLADKISGLDSNHELEEAAKKAFMVTKRSADDVRINQEKKELINSLMIENVSLLYARGLVRRYQLENEKVDATDDLNNVNAVQSVLANTIQRANNRWISMLQSEASMMTQSATIQLNATKLDDEDESAGVDKNDTTRNGGNSESVNNQPKDDESDDEEESKNSKWQDALDWAKDQGDKAKDWAEQQGDTVGDWLNKDDGKNQEGANKIIHGLFGDDSSTGSALTKGTDYLSERGKNKGNN